MRVSVIGAGYVGLVTGVAFAHINHNVICVDKMKEKIDLLNQGKSPIYEKDLEELMQLNKDRLTYTLDYKECVSSDVIFIGVPTPSKSDGTANLDYVYNVVDELIPLLEKDVILVIKSTVPIGTNDKIEEYIKSKTNYKVSLVSNPEFLKEGTAVYDTLYASRIVVGVNDSNSAKIMKELYLPLTKEPYNVPYVELDRRSAEMVKYASNNFLALKISFINEIANLCEKVGADVKDVAYGMGLDDRIGPKFLNAGIGYGGSCFPKDTNALYQIGKGYGLDLKLISSTIKVNEEQQKILFNKLKKYYNNLTNKKIAVLGLTFKPNTDDLRYAPSLVNINLLKEENAIINVYDPIVNNLEGVNHFATIDECIKDADAVMIMTEWDSIKKYDLKNYETLMKNPIILDGRNCYDNDEVTKYKILYDSIGRMKKDNR